MQLVTDRGADLAPEQAEGLDLHFAPLRLTLDGQTYSSGVDLQPDAFYRMLDETESFPTTSQPSAGDFAELYTQLAKSDPEILSVHISSGLSGTLNAAKAGAAMVPEAKVTFFDTKTLSVPEGWAVQAAARAIKAGWRLDKILPMLERICKGSDGIYTLATLKYLIHGGRISHLKGLLASLLNIKPAIGVNRETGMYETLGQDVTVKRAMDKLVHAVGERHGRNTRLRVQLLHGHAPESVEILREKMAAAFDCFFEPTVPVAPVLGAHTGSTLVGMGVARMALFDEVP